MTLQPTIATPGRAQRTAGAGSGDDAEQHAAAADAKEAP